MNPNLSELLDHTDRVMSQMGSWRAEPGSYPPPKVHTGVDLGTAYTVLIVLDEHYQPIAGEYQFAQVTRDGLVVDFIGAVVKPLPPDLAAEGHGPGRIVGENVIAEKDSLSPQTGQQLNLIHQAADVAKPDSAAVEAPDRAEGAPVAAPAAR